MDMWKEKRSAHFSFFYHPGSPTEAALDEIRADQEACYARVSAALGVEMVRPIRLFLCDSRSELAAETGCPPANALTFDYDLIYAVYGPESKYAGPHEVAHILSYQIATPESLFLREGLAMHFDGAWHGEENERAAARILRARPEGFILDMLDNAAFAALPDEITYPLAGAFASFLIEKCGMDAYLAFYRSGDLGAPLAGVERAFRAGLCA